MYTDISYVLYVNNDSVFQHKFASFNVIVLDGFFAQVRCCSSIYPYINTRQRLFAQYQSISAPFNVRKGLIVVLCTQKINKHLGNNAAEMRVKF